MIKILIADDERLELSLLNEIIAERFPREVSTRTAENGRQAVETAMLWGADIALMDIEMPGLNGIEAAKRILAHSPSCKLIFITAYSRFPYAQEAVKMGAYDYILKPVDSNDVERAVRRAIGQAETHRQLETMAPAPGASTEHIPSDQVSVLMEKVKKYLQHNYMLYDISLDSISAILHLNSSYLSVLFKKSFGVNFKDYLSSLRMNAAKELLADPFLSTSEIASMVGYESPNYFTRAFKKNTGMTPTEFRRSQGRENMEGTS